MELEKIAFATRWHAKFIHKSIGMCGWAHLNRVLKIALGGAPIRL